MSLLRLEGVSKEYTSCGQRVMALNSIDLEIQAGELVALIGSSGSGKSTLLTIMGALNPPTRGKVWLDDIEVYKLSVERRADLRSSYLGFVFQQYQLIPYLTALENVILPLAILRYNHQEQKQRAMAVLDRVGLAGKEKRLPNQLSGGEQNRVAIARAIVNRPPLVLADEPTGSLDTATGEEIMQLFNELNQDGLTIVVVTHNPDNLRYLQRTVRLRDGRADPADNETGGGPDCTGE